MSGWYAARGLPRLLAVVASLGVAPAVANPEAAAGLSAGVWRSLVAGGTNLYDFPLTPLGQRRYESFRLDQDPALTCEPPGMPRGFYYLSPMTFELDGNSVTIRYETMDIVRTAPIDGPPAPSGTPHTPNGYSVARWDGDALILDTTHLAAGETTREGFPKSARMTLSERFRVESREGTPHLVVSVTITDPENFSRPYTTVNEFVLEPDWELLPFDCNTLEYEQ